MHKVKKYKERRLYYFTCGSCGHRATTFKRKRVTAEKCRNCRKGLSVDPNQQVLFPVPHEEPGVLLGRIKHPGVVVKNGDEVILETELKNGKVVGGSISVNGVKTPGEKAK